MSKDVLNKCGTDNQKSKPLPNNYTDNQDDKKLLSKKGWLQKDSNFNKTETDNNCSTEVISRSINKLLKNEKKSRPTANPTKVCLKPEVLHESKEQFAQRIKQAWIDREQSKSCINIYLARNVIEDPLMESIEDAQESTIQVEEKDSCRTALEVQLQNHVGEGENSPEDSSEEEKPLSAAARRVRFYKTAKQQQNERQTLTRAMSAPSSRQQIVNSTQGLYSTSSRRKSQDVHKFSTRKLKSCRSKAFHKSIDVDSRLPNGQKFGKRNQNVEVVTMMSLLSPVGSDVEESLTPDDVSTKTVTFPQFNNSMRYHQKSFDSAMTSIGKPKLLNNRVGKSLMKSRTIEISRDDEDDGPVVKEVVISKLGNDDDDNETLHNKEIAQIDVRYDVLDGQPMLKSDKEKECWALFKKMTAKGVSVTFDTVLRGMLTPTEYRLRKNELLLFG
ncbi:uncharacterized protein LOC113561069 isoform X1 [Rhopalosiphum maidis]|uniref:uncharacterized protein LOC113561069 isoform X1 n=1 Tax=Rhopalosiphum maidis TaxID=43146 RepID=UPI000F00F991|nr:uncharacterized protein LOC113561069 isoform X1 [Rhopalosiphum maidis]